MKEGEWPPPHLAINTELKELRPIKQKKLWKHTLKCFLCARFSLLDTKGQWNIIREDIVHVHAIDCAKLHFQVCISNETITMKVHWRW